MVVILLCYVSYVANCVYYGRYIFYSIKYMLNSHRVENLLHKYTLKKIK